MLNQVLYVIIFVNTVGAAVTVFRKPRSIASILAWLVTLVMLPVVGFVLYLFCGRGLDRETKAKFQREDERKADLIETEVEMINKKVAVYNKHFTDMAPGSGAHLLEKYLRNEEEAILTRGNQLKFYTDGKAKFAALFEDIRNAKDNIHVEYYAFFADQIGQEFLALLVEKARAGVEVRLIYDPWGGKGSNDKFFRPLTEAGGEVAAFITSRNLIGKTRLNYHLHRKIVVVDGMIAWTGGFNVGDQYLGRSEKFGYWRDTHGRIVGPASFSLQEIFLKDWNISVEKARQLEYEDRYFVFPDEEGPVSMQVVSDGPENEAAIIKSAFVKMIIAAEDRLWIQTPYLIPDDTMFNALEIAARSGVDVRIMIPDMPDHPFIFRATQYYAKLLHRKGVKIYHYENGFLHAKTIVMDDKIASFGSTNQDIRSYDLNFEVSAFIYDPMVAHEMQTVFEADMLHCRLLTDEEINGQSRWLRFKQNFSRLLSPIL